MLTTITTIVTAAALALSGFFANIAERFDPTSEDLGRTSNAVAGKTYTLYGGGISSSDTSIVLTSFKIPVSDVPYSMGNFGDGVNAKGYLTIEPGSATKQEFISFTGLTQNSDGTATLTGVSRGLAPVYPYTASTTYQKAHPGGSVVVISNPPQLYEAIYSYIDNATTSGAVDAAASVKGIVEVASGLEAASSTPVGGGNTTAPLALTTAISTSSAPSSGNVIPVTQADGNLSASFLADSFGSTTIRVYTSTSTWTRPATSTGLKYIIVEVVGGGGGGGGTTQNPTTVNSIGGGGGGGGYAREILSWAALSATTSVHVYVGQGGAAGAAGAIGGLGTTTSFGNFLSATGGSGGDPGGGGTQGGDGGCGTGGDINICGSDGNSGANGGGSGGASYFGGGGRAVIEGNGQNGRAYGGGGGGGGVQAGQTTDRTGGAGQAGVVMVTEVYF